MAHNTWTCEVCTMVHEDLIELLDTKPLQWGPITQVLRMLDKHREDVGLR